MSELVENFRVAVDVSPVPMLLVNPEGNIVLVNNALCELFEYEKEQLIGQGVEALVPDQVRGHHPELRQAYAKAPTKRGMGAGRDLFGVTRHGESIPLELGLEPIKDDDAVWALVVAIDIRQRKQHEQHMNLAMDAAASAMVMVDDQGSIVFVNKAALDLFGYTERDILGKPVETLVPNEFQRAHPVYFNSFMNDSSTRSMGLGRDLFARHCDGTKIPVEIALTPVKSEGKKLVMSTIIDLTERIEARQTLERKNDELANLNAELSQFAYSASHDLKSPLSSISGLLDICISDLEENKTGDLLEYLRMAHEIGTRSAQKVESVLAIARASRNKVPVEPVHVGGMIREVWSDLNGHHTGITLETDLQHTDPFEVERATLGLIVDNILSNAYRYQDRDKPNKTIKVTSQDHANGLCLTISDNGIGIAEEHQEAVFHMFTRIGKQSGDGLGLALVKKQVDRLGGTITLSSVEGEGTEFTVILPKGEFQNVTDSGGDR